MSEGVCVFLVQLVYHDSGLADKPKSHTLPSNLLSGSLVASHNVCHDILKYSSLYDIFQPPNFKMCELTYDSFYPYVIYA